jgi:hypothetical protein
MEVTAGDKDAMEEIVTFQQHLNSRSKKNVTSISDTKGILGIAGNRIYVAYRGTWYLYKKFKNSSKAKKFFNSIKLKEKK